MYIDLSDRLKGFEKALIPRQSYYGNQISEDLEVEKSENRYASLKLSQCVETEPLLLLGFDLMERVEEFELWFENDANKTKLYLKAALSIFKELKHEIRLQKGMQESKKAAMVSSGPVGMMAEYTFAGTGEHACRLLRFEDNIDGNNTEDLLTEIIDELKKSLRE